LDSTGQQRLEVVEPHAQRLGDLVGPVGGDVAGELDRGVAEGGGGRTAIIVDIINDGPGLFITL